MKLLDATNLFLAHNRRIRCLKTDSHYRLAIKQYCQAFGRVDLTVDDLSDDGLIICEKRLMETMAIPTVNSQLSRIKAVWRWLAQRGHVKTWPTLSRVPEPEVITKAWTVEQVRAILDACSKTPGEICGLPAATWWRMWHHVQWESGCRTGEMLALRTEWVTKDGLDVPASARKGGRKSFYYRLSDPLMMAVREFLRPEREMIFPWTMHRASFWNHYARILIRAGLPSDRKCKPQRMRRSHLTWWAVGGGDPTSRAKHASSETTTRYYLDSSLIPQVDPSTVLPAL